MTVSSFGQSSGITFTCGGAGDISFNTPPDGTFNGKDSWSNGVDFQGVAGYTLRFETDNTWSVRDPLGPRFFYSALATALPSCNTSDWQRDLGANGQFCSEVLVICSPSNDPDNDNDGYVASVDCNDNDASINPGAAEICDDIDNNCDGVIDEGFTKTTYYLDADGDAFGSMDDVGEEFCTDPGAGYSSNNDDCDDTNASITTCIVYQYCNEEETKVVICHKGKDICVSMNAIDAHLAHGDSLGSCSSKAGNGKGGIEESVEETPISYDVAFWPNPSNSNFNVKMITPNVTEKVSIEAFDMNGRLVHTNKINGNQNYQFGNNLSTGIYIVKLTQANTVKMFKVVKQ
jgi:hypothetical protein